MDAIINSVTSLWKPDFEEHPLGWELRKLSNLPSKKFWTLHRQSYYFSLYKRHEGNNPSFMVLIHNRPPPNKDAALENTKENGVSKTNVEASGTVANDGSLVLFSACRFALLPDAEAAFSGMQQTFTILLQHSSSFFKEGTLRLLTETYSKHETYGPAHIVVHLNLYLVVKQDWLKEYLSLPDETGMYPVHVACKENRLDCLKEMILRDVDLTVLDKRGNNCIHFCAHSDKNVEILQIILKKHPELLTRTNEEGSTGMHVACLNDSILIVKTLHKAGHQLSVPSKNGYPLHLAMKNDSQECIEYLCEHAPEQLSLTNPNSSQGELPLHMVKSRKAISALLSHGVKTESRNSVGKTALHVMSERRNIKCLLRLLSCDANPDAQDDNGNTPLHCAVLTHKSINSWVLKYDEVVMDIVRALLVFGASVDLVNKENFSVRHIVSCQTKDHKLLRTLSDIGAKRCPVQSPVPSLTMLHCTQGCSGLGDFNGELINPDWNPPDLSGQIKEFISTFDRHFNLLVTKTGDMTPTEESCSQSTASPSLKRVKTKTAMKKRGRSVSPEASSLNPNNARVSRGTSPWAQKDSSIGSENDVYRASSRSRSCSPAERNHRFSYASAWDTQTFGSSINREHILCLDGGGIRGLILLICLRELQKHLKRPITDSFDWMAGTSTGGMVAAALSFGFSISKAMGMYFRFKDEVFHSVMRPYDHVPLEKLFKEYFSEEAVMTDIAKPKVLISTVLGDRVPPDLFFFSNINSPNTCLTKDLTHQGQFPPTDPPHKQLIWQVLRATSAAPTFFAPCGRMLDGGLMCNNPTLDVMTEVFRVHQSVYVSNGHFPPRIGCVVSCGTGFVPVEAKSLSIYKPSGILDGIRSVSNLIQLTSTLIDQATVAEGRPVAQAQTWCQMCDIPYVRFNPPISVDIPMNETSDSVLLKLCWEAQCFINRNQKLFFKVAKYINLSNHKKKRYGPMK